MKPGRGLGYVTCPTPPPSPQGVSSPSMNYVAARMCGSINDEVEGFRRVLLKRCVEQCLRCCNTQERILALLQLGGGDTPGTGVSTARGSVAALMANLLPQANSDLASGCQGVYVGEGLPQVPTKLAAKIRRGEFVEMTELLPEFWCSQREDDHSKQEAKARQACSVQDIFTWLQCYGLFVSILGPHHPSRIPELMAYQTTIVRASQDYAGLAWVRYDSAFRRQAALTGLTQWSAINPTLYTLCFAGSARTSSQCELNCGRGHPATTCPGTGPLLTPQRGSSLAPKHPPGGTARPY